VRRRPKSPTCQVAVALQPTYRDAGECGNFASYQYSCMSTGQRQEGKQRATKENTVVLLQGCAIQAPTKELCNGGPYDVALLEV